MKVQRQRDLERGRTLAAEERETQLRIKSGQLAVVKAAAAVSQAEDPSSLSNLPDFINPRMPDLEARISGALILSHAPSTAAMERLRGLLGQVLRLEPWRLSTNTEDGLLVQILIAAPEASSRNLTQNLNLDPERLSLN